MKQHFRLLALSLAAAFMQACSHKQAVDLLLVNGHVYTLNEKSDLHTAVAIRDGRIVASGSAEDLAAKYEAKETMDLGGQFVYPGFNDAHAHFYGLGRYMQTVELTGTTSWAEVISRCEAWVKEHGKPAFLLGRGWDQNDWQDKSYPVNAELNRLFPEVPVLLKRVDGHAAIANDRLLELAGIAKLKSLSGGEVVMKNGVPTGVLIDNAVDSAERVMPAVSLQEKIRSLKDAEMQCLQNGLTTVCDAGLDPDVINLIDSLQRAGELRIRVYAMVSATDANLDHYLAHDPYKTERLNVCSFKIYGDGALGSRGACLVNPYADMKGHHGFLVTPLSKMESYIARIAGSKYQVNTHCIGDSANRLVLTLYAKHLKGRNDRRWRIEHAQIVQESDRHFFGDFSIVPSVQPTHATSDMYWAGDRLGAERLRTAYAYSALLKQNGWMPLGTDFPVEFVNPLYTFYAAVARMDAKSYPPGGFQPADALTREQALKGMTIWGAQAAFEEQDKGTIEPGKFADFTILDVDLMKDEPEKIRNAKTRSTYINGVKVY